MTKSEILRRCIGIAAFCGFFIILTAVLTGSTSGFDDPIREALYSIQNESLTGVVTVLTNLADKYLIIALCIILLILPWTRMQYGIPLSAGALATTLLNSLLKHVIGRPRPDVLHLVEESGFSFPSGHSITSMFFYGLAILLVHRNCENKKAAWLVTILLAIPMLLIGPSRIYLGVHYPTDVLGGWCLGITAMIVIIEILDWKKPTDRLPDEPS